jgi:D-3-phosphoglycerate dehydrogenase
MKSTAYLINTARAGLVDEAALIAALEERRIGGAALDVFWTEPLPAGHPLLRMDNVTITPHLAGATQDTFRMTPYLLLRELKRVIDTNAVSEWIVS